MKNPRPIWIGIVAVLFQIIAFSFAAACSLGPASERTPAKFFEKTQYVMVARVTQTRLLDYVVPDWSDRVIVEVTYRLEEPFKGNPPKTGKVTTTSIFMCGVALPAIVGRSYLLYVSRFEDTDREFLKVVDGSLGMVDGLSSTMSPDKKTLDELRLLSSKR